MTGATLIGPPSSGLLDAAQELASARSVDDVTGVIRRRARDLIGADGVTFVLRDDGRCYYADEDAIAPLWKGKRFSMDACISGWVMRNATSVVVEDIYDDDRVPHDAYRPTFVKSLAMVPIRSDEPIGAIGAYWDHDHRSDDAELSMLQTLADFASVALRNVELIRALEAGEARYRAIVEDQTEMIVRWTPEGRRTFVNDAYSRFFGRSEEGLLDQDVFDSIHEADRPSVRKKLSELSAERSAAMDQRRIVLPDGSTVWTEWVDRALFDDEGRVREYQSVGRDIQERVELEQQLRQAQKMDVIGRLAGGVAHDFNNLLTVISGHLRLALDEADPESRLREDLLEVSRAAERAESLTRRLLAVSRSQPLEPDVVDVNEVVEGMENMLDRLLGETIDLETRLDLDLDFVWADVGQLEQVILNLAVNARDAMPDGGRVTIETRNVHLSDELANQRIDLEPGPYVVLAVTDTGVGMEEDVREHLFEPFYSTKKEGEGTGLGLSIVFGIVKQSRGSIYVYSEPGEGTTFKIYLPRAEEATGQELETVQVSPDSQVSSDSVESTDAKVLVVDDDDSVRKLVVKVLERAGYGVRAAGAPDEARSACEEGDVDLLITDMVLPDVDGLDLARELVDLNPALRVLFVSGYTEGRFSDYRSVSPVFLEKPFDGQSLLDRAREALRTPPGAGPGSTQV